MAGKKKASSSPETLDQPQEKVLKTSGDAAAADSADATDEKNSLASSDASECGRLIIVSYINPLTSSF